MWPIMESRCFRIADEPKYDRRKDKMCLIHLRKVTFLACLEGKDPPEMKIYSEMT